MPVLYYILKLSVCLIVVWLFYQLVLRRLTFYTWNRWYLMVCTALAFLLPLINISPVLEKNNWTQARFVSAIPRIPVYTSTELKAEPAPSFSEQFIGWLPYLVVIGAAVMLIRLIIQYFSLLSMRRSSRLILNGPVKVYQVDKPVIPFSFGNAIFLNQHLHGQEELKEIIRHEFIHVKQRHTIDIIWSEAICILTWYNPFSWLLRKSIRQNLEFIADQQVLKTGLDRKEYQYLLLKVIGVPSFSIASNFNFKSLKKRIAMMNKVKTARLHLVRFLLLLPLVAVILLAFRNAVKHRQQSPGHVQLADTVAPGKKSWPANVSSFRSINNKVTVTLKNGKQETYNLNNEEELAAFEEKYGRMPEPSVPPTPPAEGMPAPTVLVTAPGEPAEIEFIEAPIPPAPPEQDDCYNNKGYCLSIIETRNGTMVLIQKRNSKETSVEYLEYWNKDKKYEDKYGKLPPLPPPMPPVPPQPDMVEMPADVSGVHVKDYDVVITKKDGTKERYDLRIKEDKEKYEKKYSPASYPQILKIHAIPSTEHQPMVEMVVQEPVHGTMEEIKVRAEEIHIYPSTIAGMDSREIIAVITPKTTFKELEKLKTDLKAKGITLDWINMKAKDGELFKVEGILTKGGSKRHFNVEKFSKIFISRGVEENGNQSFQVHVAGDTVEPNHIPSKN